MTSTEPSYIGLGLQILYKKPLNKKKIYTKSANFSDGAESALNTE